MFHQPDLEELLLARVEAAPADRLPPRRRGDRAGRCDAPGPLTAAPVRVHARVAGEPQTFTGRVVLGCDGANSTIRQLAGITMEDLGFTERWLVVDIQVEDGLDTWDGVEQICDPARAATFMQVTGDRYRWEFRLGDGEDEAGLITPAALGALLRPVDRARRPGRPGDHPQRQLHVPGPAGVPLPGRAGLPARRRRPPHPAVHRPGPGRRAARRRQPGLEARPRAHRPGRAGLLASYETERRPHARALIKKAVRVGWAMTGGQDRAAAVRRIALAAAVRSDRICQSMGSTATPRLKAGALQPSPRRLLPSGIPPALRAGGLIPNPLVSAGDGPPVRLDAILAGRPAVLTARRPDAGLADFCRRHGLVLARISAHRDRHPRRPAAPEDADWIDVRLAGDAPPAGLRALAADPALTVLVRPDRVVAAVGTRSRLPRLPWYVPASAVPGYPAPAPSPARPEPAGPLPAAR